MGIDIIFILDKPLLVRRSLTFCRAYWGGAHQIGSNDSYSIYMWSKEDSTPAAIRTVRVPYCCLCSYPTYGDNSSTTRFVLVGPWYFCIRSNRVDLLSFKCFRVFLKNFWYRFVSVQLILVSHMPKMSTEFCFMQFVISSSRSVSLVCRPFIFIKLIQWDVFFSDTMLL